MHSSGRARAEAAPGSVGMARASQKKTLPHRARSSHPAADNWSRADMGVDRVNIKGLTELEREDPGPVVMVNLIRFNAESADGDGTGWEAYLRYSSRKVAMIKAHGGMLLWSGNAKAIAFGPIDREHWDYVSLLYYPSIKAYLDMMQSPEYLAQCEPHRRDACAEHVIICTRESFSKFDIALK
jgi:uncharacterized protein (DUF1330 family)